MKMRIRIAKTTSNKRNIIFAQPILVFLLLGSIFPFGASLLPFSIPDSIEHAIRYGVPFLFSLRAITRLRRKNRLIILVAELLFGLSYLFTYITGNAISGRIELYLVATLACCIPFSVFICEIEEYEYFYGRIINIAVFNSVIMAIYMLVKVRNMTTTWGAASYSMPAGYQLLFCLCVLCGEAINSRIRIKRIYYVALSILCFSMIFLFGSRGPLACFALFIAIKLLSEFRHNRVAQFVSLFIIVLVLFMQLLSSNIGSFITNLLKNIGVSSRTISVILSNDALQDSGRIGIMKEALNLIKKNLLFGTGVASDVALLGGYPHNLFLELFIDFGIILGLILSVWTIICIFRCVRINDAYIRSFSQVCFACGFCMLLISSTYLQNVYFFMFVAMATIFGARKVRFINSINRTYNEIVQ